MFFEKIFDFEFENIFETPIIGPETSLSLTRFEGISDLTLLWPFWKGLTTGSGFLPTTKFSVFQAVQASLENKDVFG